MFVSRLSVRRFTAEGKHRSCQCSESVMCRKIVVVAAGGRLAHPKSATLHVSVRNHTCRGSRSYSCRDVIALHEGITLGLGEPEGVAAWQLPETRDRAHIGASAKGLIKVHGDRVEMGFYMIVELKSRNAEEGAAIRIFFQGEAASMTMSETHRTGWRPKCGRSRVLSPRELFQSGMNKSPLGPSAECEQGADTGRCLAWPTAPSPSRV